MLLKGVPPQSLAPKASDQVHMQPHIVKQRIRANAGLVAASCALFAYFMLPQGIVVMNDDFGYLGSIIESIRRGRLWTDEWLEPWSASLTGIGATAFQLTGSMRISVFGTQILCLALVGTSINSLLRERGVSDLARVAGIAMCITFPTVLWKSLEFTSMLVYAPALLWAVWAAESRRWTVFFIAWAAAIGSRQSAIAWIVIPLWAMRDAIRPAGSPRRTSAGTPLLVTALGVATFVALARGMNTTQSQLMVTRELIGNLRGSTFAHHFAFGVGVWTIFAGLAALFLGSLPANQASVDISPRRVVCALVGAGALFTLIELLPPVFAEHYSFYGTQGVVYRNLVIFAGLSGWMLYRFTVRWDFVFAGIISLVLVSIRKDVWDYYYLDIAVLAFSAVRFEVRSESTDHQKIWPSRAAIVTSLLLACFHGYYLFEQKLREDRDYAVCAVTELALRNGTLGVDEIGHAPFGFIGWHLHRHYASNEGAQSPDIGGFMRYLRPNTTEVRFSPMRLWRDSRSLRAIDTDDANRVVASGVYRSGWFWKQRCTLLRKTGINAAPSVPLDLAHYKPRTFPLTEKEWRAAVASLDPQTGISQAPLDQKDERTGATP